MKSARGRLLTLGSAAVLLVSGCSILDQGGGEESGGTDISSGLIGEMRTWGGGCELLDDLSPIVEYMQIEDASGLAGNGYGQGMDQQSLSCNGLVVLRTVESLSGDAIESDGELWGAVVPWNTVEEAEESYVDRTVEDVALLQDQSSSLQVMEEIPLGPEWDEGVLYAMEAELSHALLLVGRDDTWLFLAEVNYRKDLGRDYFEANVDRMTDGQTVEDFAYPFENEALHRWLVDEYAPSVNQLVNDRIRQG